ncbi:M20 family metallopeptidase [Allohahella marinimesophila]|uniref:ArgE/DapE family deacylase n=1 Tax=Allohahella marinimesophila TaxID=1054972 RepID=A0ABP7PFB3_9GAMM
MPVHKTSATATSELTALQQQIVDSIDEAEWESLTTELVAAGQPDAENPLDPDMPAGREEGIAKVVAAKLQALGLDVSLHSKLPGRPNVIGRWQGGEGPKLILNDHLDTYPAGDHSLWTACDGKPFNATRQGNKLIARGTSDTRGNLACTLLAVKALRDAGVQLRGELLCIYTVDEEKNGTNGSVYVTKELGITADYEITAEPTGWTKSENDWGMSLAVAHSGHCLVEFEVIGSPSHIWRPDSGINANSQMMKILAALETIGFTHESPNRYGATKPSACVVRIHGGEPREMQFTPYRCKAVAAIVGMVPGMTADTVMADIEGLLEQSRAQDSDLTVTANFYPQSLFVSATEELDDDAQPVAAIRAAYRTLLGSEPDLYRKNAFCDTIRFSEAGIPSVTFGPGEDGWPPINEYINVNKAVAAAKIYALTILDLLGHES